MDDWDIRRVVRSHGAAAIRWREGDLDGIEVEAYGHLFDSFWSPALNHRADRYGGSLENRMRFGIEVLQEIRRQVGDDYIVGIRMVFDEMLDGGLAFDEGMKIGEILTNSGLIDFISVIRGHIETSAGLADVITNMGTPGAPHLAYAGEIKRAYD